ncbi:MAG: O-antigen ligase family protein [Synergistales bacterium]|nr:O-antigen ligase family protein [Synergistales bacterium]MDY6411127.1 O-antigen ligase family protein [Synergistales bacterium]MDY6413930.1 O-antigen ligase family protein [Synergistales bacterium]MDY6421551.1 O-antigen ligase family protein [Synergistales bacterium]MDY6425016.1 O-antigen ligase family protein [Synergistales bacterium]
MNKKNKRPEIKKIPDKFAPVPLVPAWLLMPLWFISLASPNLIYSGVNFADTLHILKWTVTGVPVAVAVLIAGVRFLWYGAKRIQIKFDVFAIIWAVLLIYCALQPLWVDIKSPTAFALEMVCFVTVWAFYVISVSSFPDWGLRPVLILANLNASINVMFAELQIRNMNNFAFLKGTFLADLTHYSSIILPTPGNYIGNTAQQNMFGLWVAVSVLGAVYLYVYDAWKNDTEATGKKIWFPVFSIILAVASLKFAIADEIFICRYLAGLFIILAFMFVWKFANKAHVYYSVFVLLMAAWNFWGLMNSTSRSATLALLTGLIMIFIIAACKFNKKYVIRFAAVMAVLAAVFWSTFSAPRASAIISKTKDVIENYETIGSRRGIWATSYALLLSEPKGVGIGQYKWHYLDGQREGYKIFNNPDWYKWQYTHWAHNEFLQFFCEGGFIGGIMFMIMYFMWFIPAVFGLVRKKRQEITITAVWGFALACVISFSAVFTRPFHRIENMVWIALAFALSNREFFTAMKFKTDFNIIKSNLLARLAGLACIAASIAGCIYISSGIYGNYLLRKALSTQDPKVQIYLLNEADKHPIVREDTQRNIAYHYLQLGEQTNDIETIVKGFNILWQQFNREPRSEDIGKIINIAQRFQIEPVLRQIASYFKPGTYHLQRIPQTDSQGRKVNALLLVNGPGSDDK